MKVVGFIPFWMDYGPRESDGTPRNLKKLGGRYLINYSVELLNKVSEVDEVVLYASEPTILQYVDKDLYYSFVKRPTALDSPGASIEEIIQTYLSNSDADVVALLHPNSPFLTAATVQKCVGAVLSGSYDSAFTAYEFQKFAWFKGSPLNYDLQQPTPPLKSIEPVILEQSSLYVFSRESFSSTKSRVAGRQFIQKVDHFEGHEVAQEEDFEIAELIVNSGMYGGL